MTIITVCCTIAQAIYIILSLHINSIQLLCCTAQGHTSQKDKINEDMTRYIDDYN